MKMTRADYWLVITVILLAALAAIGWVYININ